MNSLQNLIQRLTAIGQVTEAEEKCSKCGCTPCECDDKDKVDEAKKPDADKDEEKVDEAADMDKIPAFIRKQKEKSQTAAQDATDKRNEQSGAKVWSSKRTESAQQGLTEGRTEIAKGTPDDIKLQIKKLGLGPARRESTGSGGEAIFVFKNPNYYIYQGQDGAWVLVQTDTESAEVNETALNLLRKYAGIQEATIEEDDVEEGNEFSGALKAAKDAGQEEFEVAGKKYKVNECGDMPMTQDMSPMTSVPNGEPHMGIPAQVMAQLAQQQEPEMMEPEGPHMEVPMAAEAPKATYTLNITNGDNNLSMTTDVPDEIIHIMKLAGVNKGAEVTKKEMPAAGEEGEQGVEESGYENTPDNTKARDPQAHGDIRDWGQKGTAKASTHYTPAKQGDNPMNEQRMFEDYKNFKAGK
jgi:hypothetical protein